MARKLTTFFALICIFNALCMISAQTSDDMTDLSHDTDNNNSTAVITLDNPAEIYEKQAEEKSEPQPVTPDVAQNSDELIHDLDNNPETVDENANNNSTAPVTTETKEEEDVAFVPAAPVAPETIANNAYSIKMLLAGIFSGVFILFLALTCHYRIQMQRYKMAPFTPPRYCPEFLFPRADSEKNSSNENNRTYQAIEVGDYHPPSCHQEF